MNREPGGDMVVQSLVSVLMTLDHPPAPHPLEVAAGGSVVQHPPHNLWNAAPQLLDSAAIEDAFARLLDSTHAWGVLADEPSAGSSNPTTAGAASTCSRGSAPRRR